MMVKSVDLSEMSERGLTKKVGMAPRLKNLMQDCSTYLIEQSNRNRVR
jgi:hypothetical protein